MRISRLPALNHRLLETKGTIRENQDPRWQSEKAVHPQRLPIPHSSDQGRRTMDALRGFNANGGKADHLCSVTGRIMMMLHRGCVQLKTVEVHAWAHEIVSSRSIRAPQTTRDACCIVTLASM